MPDSPSDLPGGLPRSNAELFARSCAVIPGGVNSSIRAFKAVAVAVALQWLASVTVAV